MAQSELLEIWDDAAEHAAPVAIRDLMLQALPDLIDTYGKSSAVLGADFFDAATGDFTDTVAAVIVDSFNREQAESSVRWAVEPLFRDIPDRELALAKLNEVTDRLVKQPARDTISAACKRNHVRYARVPTGPCCEFCIMLASRGPVYGTAKKAGGEGNRFHANCRCVPVPMRGKQDYPEYYSPAALLDIYSGGSSGAGVGDVRIPDTVNLESHELATAHILADHGYKVLFREIIDAVGAKNPDALVDGEVWEFKSPTGASEKNTISEQFKKASTQARRLVLDLRRCGLDDDLAVGQAIRRFYGQKKITDLMIIASDGSLRRFSRDV